MTKQNQASNRLKKRLIDRGLTVTSLAEQIGKSRENTSRAIHQGKFPAVRKKIEEVLNAA